MHAGTTRRVLLAGDSICMSPGNGPGTGGYAPLVAEALQPHDITVLWMTENTRNTRCFLTMLEEGQIPLDVDLIHFNAGLHDIAIHADQTVCSIPLEEYRRNLQAIVQVFRARTNAPLIWASTTPVMDELHLSYKGFARREADILRYNQAASEVMQELGVPIHDLHQVLMESPRADKLADKLTVDGAHMSSLGREILAEAVSGLILERLKT